MFCGELPAERHRALHIGLLHSQSNGLVEVAAGTRRDGTLHFDTRARADHFLPAGATGTPGWLEALLALAATHADRGEELFVAPAVRSHARGEKHAVVHPRVLWVDIDHPGQLHHLWALLAESPATYSSRAAVGARTPTGCSTSRSQPPSRTSPRACGQTRSSARMVGSSTASASTDRSAERRRSGAPRSQPAQAPERFGERPPPPAPPGSSRPTSSSPPTRSSSSWAISPTRRQQAARNDIGGESSTGTRTSGSARPNTSSNSPGSRYRAAGWSSCPAPWHEDQHPSCSAGTDSTRGWKCHASGCGAGGAIYDLASVLLGAARGAESPAASSSNAPAPTSPTSSANSPNTKQPTRREPRCSRSPLTPRSRSRSCARHREYPPGAAVLKTRLHRREITLRELLEHPPAELQRQMTWEVLLGPRPGSCWHGCAR